MNTDITVIIPVYNAGMLIGRCLDSVLGQADGYGVEVVCVDDGSTDNSVEVIESRCDARVRVLRQANAGPAAARNRGMEVAQGRYMAYLDADDYWAAGFIGQTVAFLDSHAECVAVNVAQRHITTQGDNVRPLFVARGDTDGQPFVPADFWDFWADNNHVCTGSIVIRTEVARAIGGQREDLRICEDLEFWAMLAARGPIGFIPQVLFTSDGGRVTETIGWVTKMLPRWQSAPAVEEWESRLVGSLPQPLPGGFLRRRGQIARNLVYSQIMSGRTSLAHRQTRTYGRDFPRDLMSRLLLLASHSALLWFALCRLLRWREYHRG